MQNGSCGSSFKFPKLGFGIFITRRSSVHRNVPDVVLQGKSTIRQLTAAHTQMAPRIGNPSDTNCPFYTPESIKED